MSGREKLQLLEGNSRSLRDNDLSCAGNPRGTVGMHLGTGTTMGDDSTPRGRVERLADWDSAPRPVVTPSLLNCDFARMTDELAAIERAGARCLHLDVMDGHFVPNLSYGAPVITDWR